MKTLAILFLLCASALADDLSGIKVYSDDFTGHPKLIKNPLDKPKPFVATGSSIVPEALRITLSGTVQRVMEWKHEPNKVTVSGTEPTITCKGVTPIVEVIDGKITIRFIKTNP